MTMTATLPSRRRKLPARYVHIVLPLVLSILMTCIISAISTAISIGFSEGLLLKWLSAWGLSWIVAFPTLLFMLPLVRRIVATVVEMPAR